MAISQFVDTTGNILNRYTLTHEDSTTETVRLTFNPSNDYVAGTPFNALHMNPIVNKVNELDTTNTIITGTLTGGSTSITISDSRITTSSILSFYTSIYGESPTNAVVSSGSVTLTFDAQSSDMTVGVKVEGSF